MDNTVELLKKLTSTVGVSGEEENIVTLLKDILKKYGSVSVDSINEATYKVNDENITYNGYKIKVTWDYEKELGYDKTAEIIVINKDNHLYVVEENTK